MKTPKRFIYNYKPEKKLFRAAKSEKNLPTNTFFALNKAGAAQYAVNGKNIYEFKPSRTLKLFKLNKASLDYLENMFPNIKDARNYAYPTIIDTRKSNKPEVMGRFSEYSKDTLNAEKAVMGAIKKLGDVDGYIITKGVPVTTMGKHKRATNEYVNTKSMAASAVFKPEVAIFNAKAKVSIPKVNIKPAAFNAKTPSPTRKTAGNASYTPPPGPLCAPPGPRKGRRPLLFPNSP